MSGPRADTVVFDIDGTLVDSNYQHAIAWHRAFGRYRIQVPVWRCHRHIGMGGDQLVTAIAGEQVEAEHGDDLRAAHSEEFAPFKADVQPLPGAHDLLEQVASAGAQIVLASSGKRDEVERYVDLLGARDLASAWTSSADVERTKPAPDLIAVAVEKVDGSTPVVVGDSIWDFKAASKLSIPGYAVRTGGFSVDELREAGADDVVDSLEDLGRRLGEVLERRAG